MQDTGSETTIISVIFRGSASSNETLIPNFQKRLKEREDRAAKRQELSGNSIPLWESIEAPLLTGPTKREKELRSLSKKQMEMEQIFDYKIDISIANVEARLDGRMQDMLHSAEARFERDCHKRKP